MISNPDIFEAHTVPCSTISALHICIITCTILTCSCIRKSRNWKYK